MARCSLSSSIVLLLAIVLVFSVSMSEIAASTAASTTSTAASSTPSTTSSTKNIHTKHHWIPPAHLPNYRASSNTAACKYGNDRVIIVGAGLSGLAAATRLLVAGCHNVTVLEARSRLGGRIHTNHKLHVEYGAGWIHGSSHDNAIYHLAKSHGLRLKLVGGDSGYIGGYPNIMMIDSNGKVMDEKTKQHSLSLINKVWTALNQMPQNTKDRPLCETLTNFIAAFHLSKDEEALLRWHFEILFAGDNGADTCDLSTLRADGNYDTIEAEDSILLDGYDSIVQILARGVDVQFNTHVTEIEHNAKGVRVVTKDQEVIEGAAVIVTVPLGILRAPGRLQFTPALSVEKMDAISRIQMGTLNRIALEFPYVFWPSQQYSFGYASKNFGEFPMMVNNYIAHNTTVLEFMIGGRQGKEIEAKTDEAIVNWIMETLKTWEIFAHMSELPRPRRTLISRWSRDQFTLGSYSFPTFGSLPSDFETLAAPLPHHRVLFAGEHTSSDHYGTAHGAYESGIREAERLLYLGDEYYQRLFDTGDAIFDWVSLSYFLLVLSAVAGSILVWNWYRWNLNQKLRGAFKH